MGCNSTAQQHMASYPGCW